MIGDDHVIRYTGADDDIGDAVDTQATEWGLALGLELGIWSCFHLLYLELGICNNFRFNFIWIFVALDINLNFPALGIIILRRLKFISYLFYLIK